MAGSKRRSPHDAAPSDEMLVLRGPLARKHGPFEPKREGDVGFDLVCVKDTVIPPGVALAPTDIPCDTRVKLPSGTFAMVVSRSGTHTRFPTLMICSAPIDNGYTGPLDPRFRNIGTDPVIIVAGTALAQLVLYSAIVPQAREVRRLPKTDRGSRGFGSTGR